MKEKKTNIYWALRPLTLIILCKQLLLYITFKDENEENSGSDSVFTSQNNFTVFHKGDRHNDLQTWALTLTLPLSMQMEQRCQNTSV